MTECRDKSEHLERTLELAERYAVLIEAVSEGVYDWDIRSDRLEVSGRIVEITGLAGTDLTAADWSGRIHVEDAPGYRNSIVRHFKGETHRLQCEYRIRRSTGDFVWIADTGKCLRDDDGTARRLVGAIRDITSRKLANAKLRAARQAAEAARANLSDAIESISEGLVLFDAEDRVVLSNTNYRRYFAATAGEDVASMIEPGAVFWDFLREGHRLGMLPLIGEQGGFEAYFARRKEMRRGQSRPIEQLLSDGRWLQINEHRTKSGGIASVYTEITDLKRREEELAVKTEELEAVSSQLSKYLAPQVYAAVFSGSETVAVTAKRRKLTVFFSDLVGFTSLVDQLESEELTGLLNEYLTEMSLIAFEHGATLDKFIGDAIMAFFGDPVSRGVDSDAKACVAMARAMQVRLAELNRRWRERGLACEFQLRIGVATGFCTVGNFGSEERLDYTAVGHAVNLAARLQAHAEHGGILLDSETFFLARDMLERTEEMTLELKGIVTPVRAFSVGPTRNPEADQISVRSPNAQIHIDVAAMSDDECVEAREALREALMRLKRTD